MSVSRLSRKALAACTRASQPLFVPKPSYSGRKFILRRNMAFVYDDIDPSYARSCSDVTLYSNPKGFFKNLAEETVDLASDGDWLKTTFSKAPGDAGKLAAVLENQQLMEPLSEVLSRIQPMHRGKDGRVSQERRLAAQRAFEDGNLMQALALASQAVLKAPAAGVLEMVDGGVSLALALWVRSEILLGSGRPRAALEDLKQALKERLPAKMRSSYYWRMGHCYKGAGEPTRAKVSYELAARLLAKDPEACQKLAQDIQSLEEIKERKVTETARTGISLTSGAKQNMPALSKLVKISEEGDKGRFAVANAPIKTGDVLLVESPYAACLLSDCYGTHCLHCFKRLEDCSDEAPAPCLKCSGVAFCSIQCRDIAVSTYHKHECEFLDLFIGSGMSILSYISLRMVTQAGLETCLSIHSKYITNEVKLIEGSTLNDIEGVAKKAKMKSRKERLNRTKKGLKSLDKLVKEENDEQNKAVDEKVNLEENLEIKAAQIYALCTHSEMRNEEDYLKRIVMTIFLIECLKKAGFFGKCDEESMKKYEKVICEILLKNLQLLQFNAHELYETVRGAHRFSGSKALYIAVGIYPTGALFNHECYPAVARYFEGRKIVLRATRPLVTGDVVSENYGPHFLVRGQKERQRSLACRYWFRCQCRACSEDWPTLKMMAGDAAVPLKCTNTSCKNKFKLGSQLPARCGRCSTDVDKELMRINMELNNSSILQYQEGAKLMERELAEEAIACLCPAVDQFHALASLPHKETHLAQESLRSCFAACGNVHEVKENNNN